jgi:hypothetical protein
MHGTFPPRRYCTERFARSAAISDEQSRRFNQERKREQEKATARDDAIDDDFLDLAVAVIMAGDRDIASLQADIDGYQAQTIEVLHANELDLLEARRKVEEMLEKAYVLPDGRRVFKTEDGLQVFDENGNQIPADQLDPDELNDLLPKWESYSEKLEELERLEAEREALVAYQAKLDEAEKRLEAGDLTQGEFDQIKDGLLMEMPQAVRARVPELVEQQEAAKTANPAKPASLIVDDDMIPGSSTAAGPVPG